MRKSGTSFESAPPLGQPLPLLPHAVSVAMPKWRDVIAYEEGDPTVHSSLACGYPRFVFHPLVREVFARAENDFADKNEYCLVFPSVEIARRCVSFIAKQTSSQGRIHDWDRCGVAVAVFAKEVFPTAKQYWQHSGEILSSRHAQAILEDRATKLTAGARLAGESKSAKENLRRRIAGLAGVQERDVFLLQSGMAALTYSYRLLQTLFPARKTVQLGFPYVDTLKVQEKFGTGVEFFPMVTEADLRKLDALVARGEVSGVFCEFPTNPLLQSLDLGSLSNRLRAHRVPLVIDDSLSSFANHHFGDCADILVSSLTKSFSGMGDAMGGTAIFNPTSPLYSDLHNASLALYEDNLWHEDAVALELNSRDFTERLRATNQTAEELCEHLRRHPAVASVYYPKYVTPENYSRNLRQDGGYGSLFSLRLHDGAQTAPKFYDHLQVWKGPSFGLNQTLACPYTLLAHYGELQWAEACGVPADLVRVSVGLETASDLIERFDQALSAALA